MSDFVIFDSRKCLLQLNPSKEKKLIVWSNLFGFYVTRFLTYFSQELPYDNI